MRRAIVLVDVTRVATFRAVVLWILRVAHATDGRPACMRQPETLIDNAYSPRCRLKSTPIYLRNTRAGLTMKKTLGEAGDEWVRRT